MRTGRAAKYVAALFTLVLVAASCGGDEASPGDESSPEEEGESRELVVVGWGGNYQAAQAEAYFEPFEQETGIKIIQAESPEHARIVAQVDSGNPEWDVITTGLSAHIELGEDYFEPIDYEAYPEAYAAIPEEFKQPLGIASATFCYGLAYRTDVFTEANAPKTWEDFWNTEEFPGPRGMALDGGVPWNSTEAAWMSTGEESVLNIDLDTVFEQFTALEPNIGKWWGSGAESLQIIANKEVVMEIAPTGDLYDLVVNQQAPVAISWDGAFCGNDYWYILKGSPNADAAQQLIAFMQDPERQAAFAELAPFGVPNPDAYELMPEEVLKWMPTAPENIDLIYTLEDEAARNEWWAENREEVVERYAEWRLQQ